MMATLMQPTHGAPRNNKLFPDFQYINLVKFFNATCEKVDFQKVQKKYFKTRKNLL